MCEKSEDSLGQGHGNLPEDRAFLENYLAGSRGAPQESSVEYLQAVARVRLCLSRAAELIFDLQQHTSESDCSAAAGNAGSRAGGLDTVSALCSARTCCGAWPRVRAAAPFVLGGASLSVPCTTCYKCSVTASKAVLVTPVQLHLWKEIYFILLMLTMRSI